MRGALRYLVLTAMAAASGYLTLLLVDTAIHLTKPGHGPAAADPGWFDRCPVEEHLRVYPFQNMGPLLVRRPIVGWVLKPHTVANPKGYLGQCVPYAKPPGVRRVVLLGDSFTGAIQVPYGTTFASRTETLLRARGPASIEVINLGVGGYGTDQEYFTLVGEARRYAPDLVVHVVFLGNDISDNSYELYGQWEYPFHYPHPIKRYISVGARGEFAYREADLDYYFEMNLAVMLTTGHWTARLSERDLRASFAYERGHLVGTLSDAEHQTPVDTLTRVRFDGSPILGLYLRGAGAWLDATEVTEDRLAGVIEGGDRRWELRRVPAAASNWWDASRQGRAVLTDRLGLVDLRAFAKRRLVSDSSRARWLFERDWVTRDDIPMAHLLAFQGGYPANYRLFLQDDDPTWERAWQVTFRLLEAMRDFTVRILGARYFLLVIPSVEMVYSEYWALAQSVYPELRRDAARMDVTKPIKRLEAFLEAARIEHLSLYAPMVEEYQKRRSVLYDLNHAHLTEAGHAFVARRLVDTVLAGGRIER